MTIDAVLGVTGIVETMHATITSVPGPFERARQTRTDGLTGLIYLNVRGVTQVVGVSLDALLTQLALLPGPRDSSPEREAAQSALNGVVGDYLVATDNPLAIPLQLRQGGQPLDLAGGPLPPAPERMRGKILLLVHGLCMTDLQWRRAGHDHGALLAEELGYAPVYARYNTGLHISANGRALADALERLVERWPAPVQELVIVGHSMGGLVARSAAHYGAQADHVWARQLRALIFLGTPHHGAPLERGGNWANVLLDQSPYTAAFTRLGQIRSVGITDLRHGSLLDEDWADGEPHAWVDERRPVPLPPGVRCCAVAATTGQSAGDLSDLLLGDGLVSIASALGMHPEPGRDLAVPAEQRWVACGTNHLDLLSSPAVYERLRGWLAA